MIPCCDRVIPVNTLVPLKKRKEKKKLPLLETMQWDSKFQAKTNKKKKLNKINKTFILDEHFPS